MERASERLVQKNEERLFEKKNEKIWYTAPGTFKNVSPEPYNDSIFKSYNSKFRTFPCVTLTNLLPQFAQIIKYKCHDDN